MSVDLGWMEDAACRDEPKPVFFDRRRQREAKTVCRTCPVEEECLDYALGHDNLYGVWGGCNEPERAWLRRWLSRPGRAPATSI